MTDDDAALRTFACPRCGDTMAPVFPGLEDWACSECGATCPRTDLPPRRNRIEVEDPTGGRGRQSEGGPA